MKNIANNPFNKRSDKGVIPQTNLFAPSSSTLFGTPTPNGTSLFTTMSVADTNNSNQIRNTKDTRFHPLNSASVSPVRTSSKTNLLGDSFSREIRPFIDVIDSLRRFGVDQDVDLPRVVVVGDQSSGKSSIIEAISGVELPRGSGIVTRCPLELQLMRVPPAQAWTATVSYGLDRKIHLDSPTLVDASIREAQNQICGSNKGISDCLITLRIESPAENAPDLTLIDLPGIARTAVKDQSNDICEKIRQIIRSYIVRENTVILCVVSANLDPAVNESIGLARQYDLSMERTFGVITKPDLAEEHLKDGVLCLLNNEKIPLSKGYLMVKCRSQKDLDDKISLEESLDNEHNFFKHDAIYKDANSTILGTGNLARKITEELVNVIGVTLGSIVNQINVKLDSARARLLELPKGVPSSPMEKYIYLHSMVSELNDVIKVALTKGQSSGGLENLFIEWRPVFEKFKNILSQKSEEALNNELSESQLLHQMNKRRGEEICGFLNYDFFKVLVQKEIETYESPALQVPSKISTLTEIRIKEIIKNHFGNLSTIQNIFNRIVTETIKTQMVSLTGRVKTILKDEHIIFTMDATFEENLENLVNIKGNLKFSGFQQKNAQEMRNLLTCYLKIVNRRLADQIPMVTRNCLHLDLCNLLREQFLRYATLAKDNINEVVREDTSTEEKRKMLVDQIERLEKAQKKLCELNL